MSTEIETQIAGRQPHYARLAQSLLRDIETGRYPVGSLLPTEIELTRHFNMSRHTVREAMRRLQQLGVVTRQQGVGTRVKASTTATKYVHKVDSIADLFQYVRDARLVIHDRIDVTADEALASRLGCREGHRWVKLKGVRLIKGNKSPICFTEVFISYEYSTLADQVGRTQTPIYRMIEQKFGVQIIEVRQQIRAVALSSAVARTLAVKPQSPGLSIVRHYVSSEEREVEIAFNTYPADRFTYSERLRRDQTAE